ncbi:type II secretion system protein F [Photobacterium lipolyticum]|uniref:Type II secretion system protein F n=1 Tax=Photobacterium lipolyticum TaxID=266810 RepID=A0A2T3N4K4_9GAMM|nr:type II secretion system F family protein [Photobacterium lipolyticum]PSW07396.1 type II secretion system protein F [Photobacterium lipolyticum]
MILSLSLILFGIAAYLHVRQKENLKNHFLIKNIEQQETESVEAVNLGSLYRAPIYRKLKTSLTPVFLMLGKGAWLKLVVYFSIITVSSAYINQTILRLDHYWLPVLTPVIGFFFGWQWLLNKRRQEFEHTFPDALNIMMSAVTAGESITQSISYVGKTMDNNIGQEFHRMGEHLKLGEPPEQVFKRACKNVPYPAFLFFIVTIRANMARGGQLKNVMARLIRVLVDARTLEKKKMAMTSEARLSAKIVAIIPLAFMVLLNYINPDNVNFVLTDPSGRLILYYVLGSESLGLFIVWLLVRGVR